LSDFHGSGRLDRPVRLPWLPLDASSGDSSGVTIIQLNVH
jgi:hypothetical protein